MNNLLLPASCALATNADLGLKLLQFFLIHLNSRNLKKKIQDNKNAAGKIAAAIALIFLYTTTWYD